MSCRRNTSGWRASVEYAGSTPVTISDAVASNPGLLRCRSSDLDEDNFVGVLGYLFRNNSYARIFCQTPQTLSILSLAMTMRFPEYFSEMILIHWATSGASRRSPICMGSMPRGKVFNVDKSIFEVDPVLGGLNVEYTTVSLKKVVVIFVGLGANQVCAEHPF